MNLAQIIDPNERVMWQGKPHRGLFVLGKPGIYLFALIWGIFDIVFFSLFFKGINATDAARSFNGVFVLFMLLHMAPVWIAIFGPIYRLIISNRIEYMVTDRRVYLSSGIFGTDITSVEFRDIRNLSVNVNPLENMAHVGTLYLSPFDPSGYGSGQKSSQGLRLMHISQPYEVYNLIKRLSLDVTTDQQYPNPMLIGRK